jgi:tetratricopeptide (TPR) repeat protein
MLEHEEPPLSFEVVARRHAEPSDLALLEAPWELLADQHGYLVASRLTQLAPIRRIGEKGEPLGPQRGALTVLFMAASPRGVAELDFEGEEARILNATRGLPLDLFVEESGSARELGQQALRLAAGDNSVHVVHLTCHGCSTPKPRLLLEDETGAVAETSAEELQSALGALGKKIGLLCLSACKTAAQRNISKSDSLALDLVRSGSVAVLGWAAPVGDKSATRFAGKLYERLARGDTDLEVAVAEARRALLTDQSPYWHLSRLFLGPRGGGRLSELDGVRRKSSPIHETFLGGNRRIPVAGPDEFVGRRRILQRALRALREDGKAGIILHGASGLGKSSVAARVIDRMSTHTTIVLHGYFAHVQVIESIAAKFGSVESWRRNWGVRKDETGPALRELLMDRACRLMLVLDDFEQMLEERVDGLHVLRAEVLEMVRGIVHAFAHTNGRARLIITSRFEFELADRAGNALAERLTAIPLASFTDSETDKRIFREPGLEAKLQGLRLRCGRAAYGNPMLLSLFLRRAAADPSGCEQLVTQAEGLPVGGSLDDDELVSQLQHLALEDLCSTLNAVELELLRASLLFDVPIPVVAISTLAQGDQLHVERDARRLVALGVWDVFPDVADPEQRAISPNRLVAQWALRAGLLRPGAERRAAVIRAVLPKVRCGWTTISDRLDDRDCLQAGHWAARMALEIADHETLAHFARLAVGWSSLVASPDELRSFSRGVVDCLHDSGQLTDARLLIQVARIYQTAPDGEFWSWCLEQASSLGASLSPADLAGLQLELSRMERRRGQVGIALQYLENAAAMCKELFMEREVAIIRGETADILFNRGELDDALRILNEALPIYERLGDKRSWAATLGASAEIMVARSDFDGAINALAQGVLPALDYLGDDRLYAMTLGTIADIQFNRGNFDDAHSLLKRELAIHSQAGDAKGCAIALSKMADILFRRGQVDEALKIHRDVLSMFDRLGDIRSRAVAKGRIADILSAQGQLVEALRIRREEELPVFVRLGDLREQAITLGKIAEIISGQGQVDEALRVLRQDVLPLWDRLGDVRQRAIVCGQIGSILLGRGEYDEVLRIRKEEELPVFEQTGDFRSCAVTWGGIADIMQMRGEYDEALRIRNERELPLYARIGEVRSQALVRGKIADILAIRGRYDEALQIRREEEMPAYERLGEGRERAWALGKIADILCARGEYDEAFRLRREEQLPIFEQMGDVRGCAMAWLSVADILVVRKEYDEAFRIYGEQAPIFERLGDIHSRAACRGRIAGILLVRGEREEALRIRQMEELPVYEQLGDVRLRAMTLGRIADIKFAQGRVEEALQICEQELSVFEALNDARSRVLARMRLAKVLVGRSIAEDRDRIISLLIAAMSEARRLRLTQVVEIEQIIRQIAEDPTRPPFSD